MRRSAPIALGALLVVAVVAQAGCGDCPGRKCPDGADVRVMTSTFAQVNGVEATLTGAGSLTVTMRCEILSETTLCSWPPEVRALDGTYSLQVAAPGFQSVNVTVSVTVSSDPCGCQVTRFVPNLVVLEH